MINFPKSGHICFIGTNLDICITRENYDMYVISGVGCAFQKVSISIMFCHRYGNYELVLNDSVIYLIAYILAMPDNIYIATM